MKAAVVDRYGPPDVFSIREVAKPVPKDGEVLIRIHAALATPSDCAFRSANPFIVRLFAGPLRPKWGILGDSIAGEVESVGRGVTRFKVGDRVMGSTGLTNGAYAEYCAVAENQALIEIPSGQSFAQAVAICEGFLTALPFLRDEAKLKGGERLLVNGASGNIGATAVQLGKHFGAEVTGVCSGRNVELVKGLGADRVIDYTREDFTAELERYDVIFDAVGMSSFSRSARAQALTGIYMTTVPSWGIVWHMLTGKKNARGKRALLATTGLRPVANKAKDLALMNELIEAGRLRAVIDRHFPLEQIADAHRYVETGRKRGSVVIDVAAPSEEVRVRAA
jgi:NADPH:quinone reductase-like Zn-dependent oxidoreductase